MQRVIHPLRLLLAAVIVSVALTTGGACAWAQAQSSAAFAVRSAYLHLVDDVYLLDARLHLPIDAQLRSLLNDGVALKLEFQLEVSRSRNYWPDEGIASLAQQYELQYHAVSDRYVVRNLNSGEQTTYPEFEPALEHLTRFVGVPILDRAVFGDPSQNTGRSYEVRMRAITDVGGMPAALRWIMFWADDWHRTSEWYVWSLKLP